MAYRYDNYDKSLVIDGFEQGIADSPFSGIADEKNVNIISVPGEASVNFKTLEKSITINSTFSVTSANVGTSFFTVSSIGSLENGIAIIFSTTPTITTTPTLSANTPYWITSKAGSTFKLLSTWPGVSSPTALTVTGDGTGVFRVVNVGDTSPATAQSNMLGIKQFAADNRNGVYYGIDSLGQVWSDASLTTSGYWTYTGNLPPSPGNTAGNGIVFYTASDLTGYLIIFHNSSIDYTKTASGLWGWQYQWNPQAGSVGGYSPSPSARLHTGLGFSFSHEALVGQDNTIYYCDSNWIGSIFEKPLKVFNPLDTTTYTWSGSADFYRNANGTLVGYALQLPYIERANCLTELGVNLLVGGQRNLIYPWDRVSTSFTFPIFLSESGVSKMVTVNTNAYLFIGNRGRIYITNGSQAQLFKKIPDHISGTVEPYFTWGGATFNKNQLYFSAKVTANDGSTPLNFYGGLWAIDLDTKAIRLTNKLTYGTYAGYATALISIVPAIISPSNPNGVGIYIGWDSGATTYGIDGTTTTPYTTSVAQIDSDLIPIGTYDKPRDMTRVEYRLSKPMVAGESVTINYRLDFSQAWSQLLTDSTVGNFSLSKEVNFKNAQWLQLQAILNSTASTPSFTRLREFRINGITPQNG